jgi:GTP cyclohydrolase I
MNEETIHEKRKRAAIESNKRWSDPDVKQKRIDGIKKSYDKNNLRQKRSETTKKQMENDEQIQIRKDKCGKWMIDKEKKKIAIEKMRVSNSSDLTLLRQEVVNEAEGKCARCGKIQDKMCIHHIDGYHYHNEKENLVLLCQSCHAITHNAIKRERVNFYGNPKVANHIAEAMIALKLDLNDPNLKETPQRIARVWEEFAAPDIDGKKEERIKYIMSRKFPSDYNDMVICDNIMTFGLCPHHFLPIAYTIHFAYIPQKFVLGLSKIIDVIKNICKSPKLQEDLGDEIVNIFMNELQCQGCMCVIKGIHNCMTMRDVEARESCTITSSVKGCFATNDKNCKGEFLSLINKK